MEAPVLAAAEEAVEAEAVVEVVEMPKNVHDLRAAAHFPLVRERLKYAPAHDGLEF